MIPASDRRWQQVEGALMAGATLPLALMVGGLPLWAVPLVLLAPDLSMIGYLAGPRWGARLYNAAHLYATGAVIAAAALILTLSPGVLSTGLLVIAHAGIDRAFGFGLKRPSGFKDTHMGSL